jgi:hypothetical protein
MKSHFSGITNREIRKEVKQAVAAGCEFRPSKNGGHSKIIVHGKGVVTVSASPSDRNAHRQIIRDLRRYGVTL